MLVMDSMLVDSDTLEVVVKLVDVEVVGVVGDGCLSVVNVTVGSVD